MADALASGASACKGVRVRVPLSAYIKGDVVKEILWHLFSIFNGIFLEVFMRAVPQRTMMVWISCYGFVYSYYYKTVGLNSYNLYIKHIKNTYIHNKTHNKTKYNT